MTNKRTCKEGHGLELALTRTFLPSIVMMNHRETGNGNHICSAIQLYSALAILCLCYDFYTWLYRSAKPTECQISSNK